jgi:hypothetical protein
VTAGEVRRDQLHTVLKTSCPQEAPFVSVYEPLTSVFDRVSGSDGYARGDILYVHTQVTRVTSISCSMQGRRQRGGRRGLQPHYCLCNKGTLLQSPLKFSAINECLGVDEGVHTLTCITMKLSFNLL